MGSSFQPLESFSRASGPMRSPAASHSRLPPLAAKPAPSPPLPKDVAIEKYSGLRLRSDHQNDDLLRKTSAAHSLGLNLGSFMFQKAAGVLQ